jgi:hypothetical protein
LLAAICYFVSGWMVKCIFLVFPVFCRIFVVFCYLFAVSCFVFADYCEHFTFICHQNACYLYFDGGLRLLLAVICKFVSGWMVKCIFLVFPVFCRIFVVFCYLFAVSCFVSADYCEHFTFICHQNTCYLYFDGGLRLLLAVIC